MLQMKFTNATRFAFNPEAIALIRELEVRLIDAKGDDEMKAIRTDWVSTKKKYQVGSHNSLACFLFVYCTIERFFAALKCKKSQNREIAKLSKQKKWMQN